MPIITKSQETVLETLYDVATHEGGWIILKNKYHSPAAALIRRGYVEKSQTGFERPHYIITQAGFEYWKNREADNDK